jgi:hypothetical protein
VANDQKHMEYLATLLRPHEIVEFTAVLCRWLHDAHETAADLQPARRNSSRGNWDNNTSFGTDRYQYLRATASSLVGELPGLMVDTSFQALLLKLPKVGMYPLLMPSGPDRSLGDASELRRELFGAGDGEGLFPRLDAWFSGRERLFLPWNGTEAVGLTGLWAGQGTLQEDNHIDWTWRVQLYDVASRLAAAVPSGRPAPDAFGLPQPMLPLRPRSEAPAATE